VKALPAVVSARRLIKATAHRTGVFAALARRRAWPGVAVLCYHAVRATATPPEGMPFAGLHVPVAHLAAHLAELRRMCHPIALGQLIDHVERGTPLPPRAVHITFDDGYRSVATRALPLLEAIDVPASVFICTRPVATGTHFWYDAMSRAEGDLAVVARRDQGACDWNRVVESWSPPAPQDDELAPLSIDEVRQLSAHPLIEIGSHTATHPPLAQLGPAAQRREIAEAMSSLEQWTGVRPRAFAYPIGRRGRDYDARTVAILRTEGVALAFTTEPAWASARAPALEQPRFMMVDGWDAAELAYRLASLWQP